GDFALGEERIAKSARLGGIFELVEEFALARDTVLEGQAARRLDGSDAVVGGLLVAGAPSDRLAHCIEDAGIGPGLGQFVVAGPGSAAGGWCRTGGCRLPR